MEQFTIRIAGHVVAVTSKFPYARVNCANYRCDDQSEFAVEITPQDIAFERMTAEQEREAEGLPEKLFADPALEWTALQRKIAEKLFEYDTLLFHGSVIAVDGEAYLFTAKSGTGKSTHTSLWREMLGERAVMVNDDKPFLKVLSDNILVCGSPWNGKHGLGNNIDVPLKAICILERGEDNHISRISANEAVLMLLQQSNRPQQPGLMFKYMDLVESIANKVAFYRMKCNMDIEAARISYEAMSGNAKEN